MKRIGFLLMAILLFVGVQTSTAGINIDSLKNELKNEIVKSSKELHEIQKDSFILSKLSNEQLIELKRQEFQVERERIEKEGRNEMPLNGFGIFSIIKCNVQPPNDLISALSFEQNDHYVGDSLDMVHSVLRL